jgi:uncharacterized repeat protein (TIGR01451 family)
MSMRNSVVVLFLILFSNHSFAQLWNWSRIGPGAANSIQSKSVAVDKWNNVVIMNGYGNGNFNSNGNSYLAKYSAQGQLQWQVLLNGADLTHELAIDDAGYIYMLSSRFTSLNGIALTTPNTPHLLSKFSPRGKFIWARPLDNIVSTADVEVTGIATLKFDEQQSLFLSVSGRNNVTISDSVSIPANGCTSCNHYDALVVKLDTAGKVKWIRRFENSPNGLPLYGAAARGMDVHNNEILFSGLFENAINIDGQTLTQTGKHNFVTVLNATTGARKWARQFSGSVQTGFRSADNSFKNYNALLISITGSMQFGSFTIASPDNGTGKSFLCMMDSLGTPRWVRGLDARNWGVQVHGIKPGHYLVTGQFVADGVPAQSERTVKKYDTSGTLIYNLSAGNYPSLWPKDSYATPNGILAVCGYFNPGQQILGGDTLLGPGSSANPFVSMVIDNPATIRGRAYFDLNNSNTFDAADRPAPHLLIRTQLPGFNALTNLQGQYQLRTDTGTIQLSPARNIPYYTPVPPSYTIVQSGYGQMQTRKDFVYKPVPNINDLVIDVTAITPARPGFPLRYRIAYRNEGTTILSGSVSLKLNPQLTYNSSDSVPVLITPDSLVWNFSNLQPMQERSIQLATTLSPTAIPTQSTSVTGYVYPIVGDTTPVNNVSLLPARITSSFDPNDKLVLPFADVSYDSTITGKQYFTYTLRFQNTGTDTAFDVRIRDTLSSLLNLNSIEMIAASHPFVLSGSQGQALEFHFPNILLPDSNRNEPRSHGYVKFRIRPLTTVLLSDTIFNTGHIYFDYNAPVVTNRTRNYFRSFITGVGNLQRDDQLCRLMPNPASTALYLLFNKPITRQAAWLLTDAAGRAVRSGNWPRAATGEMKTIALQGLPAGWYHLRIQTGQTVFTRKIVKE